MSHVGKVSEQCQTRVTYYLIGHKRKARMMSSQMTSHSMSHSYTMAMHYCHKMIDPLAVFVRDVIYWLPFLFNLILVFNKRSNWTAFYSDQHLS